MSQININDLTFSYDSTYYNIFEHASFQIDTDWKLGFIGRNGRGKTTFLNLLLGKYEYKGSISSEMEFDYFPFSISDTSIAAKEIMKEKIAPYQLWEKKLRALEGSLLKEDLNEYGTILDLYLQHDGYQIDELIEREIGKLGLAKEILARSFCTLSNGEQTKIMLASLFLRKNQFLLLDEPTNHLDLDGRQVIADYLKNKKGFILVSHDRTLLDQVIDHVLSINKASIEVQKGNYSSWKLNKDYQDLAESEENSHLKKEIKRMTELARRTSGWSDQIEATKIGTHSGDRGYIGHKAAKMMKKAKVFEHRQEAAMEEKKGLLKNIEKTAELKMNLLEYPKKKLMEAENLSIFYGKTSIFNPVSFCVNTGDRIWLKGANGCGKSSILKLILEEKNTFHGRYSVGNNLVMSYVSQDTSHLTGLLKDFIGKKNLDETIFKTVLSQLNFSETEFDKDILNYSEGQKKKVLLAKSLAEPAHIFLWDEPLNFIDVLSRVQIEELILKYKPTMIFVEHDKTFSEKIATDIVEVKKGILEDKEKKQTLELSEYLDLPVDEFMKKTEMEKREINIV